MIRLFLHNSDPRVSANSSNNLIPINLLSSSSLSFKHSKIRGTIFFSLS